MEQFKQTNQNKIEYCWAFVVDSQPEEVRHFGLQILHYIVTKEWPGVQVNFQTTQTRSRISQLLLEYAARGTRHMLEEKLFIKEKLASIFSSIIELSWPKM